MLIFLLAFIRFTRVIAKSLRDPEVQSLGSFVFIILMLGTVFFYRVEKWSLLDSFYFSVITLASVGYGDFTPHTMLGKIFVIMYIFIGGGVLVSFITILAHTIISNRGKKT